jgi:DNA mismatch endonuclease (patch repair protein)
MEQLVDPARSALMARIRGKNTSPELIVRKAIHARGLRFRLHRKNLPGGPDIVLPKYRLIIFVHGCFWHQHAGCKLAHRPKSRVDFWNRKLDGNIARDGRIVGELSGLGWRVEVVWECETRRLSALRQRLTEIFGPFSLAST